MSNIVVIDTGYDGKYEINKYDFVKDLRKDSDPPIHGTGVINKILEINPTANITLIKAFSYDGTANIDTIIDALIKVDELNVTDIVNLSFVAERSAETERIIPYINKLLNKGVKIVAACGSSSTDLYNILPAGIPGVISIIPMDAKTNKPWTMANIHNGLNYGIISESPSEAAAIGTAKLSLEEELYSFYDYSDKFIIPNSINLTPSQYPNDKFVVCKSWVAKLAYSSAESPSWSNYDWVVNIYGEPVQCWATRSGENVTIYCKEHYYSDGSLGDGTAHGIESNFSYVWVDWTNRLDFGPSSDWGEKTLSKTYNNPKGGTASFLCGFFVHHTYWNLFSYDSAWWSATGVKWYNGSLISQGCSSGGYTYYFGVYHNGSASSITWPAMSTALDINGIQNGSPTYSPSWGTFSVDINGTSAATNVSDFCVYNEPGTSYSVKNIKPLSGYTYVGASIGSSSSAIQTTQSTISGSYQETITEIWLHYRKNYVLSFSATGGKSTPQSISTYWGANETLPGAIDRDVTYTIAPTVTFKSDTQVSQKTLDTIYTTYKFSGWEYAGSTYTANSTYSVTGDALFNAKWAVDNNVYPDVTLPTPTNVKPAEYVSGDSAGPTITINVNHPSLSLPITRTAMDRLKTYSFNNWKSLYSYKTYNAGEIVSITRDTTFEATWNSSISDYTDCDLSDIINRYSSYYTYRYVNFIYNDDSEFPASGDIPDSLSSSCRHSLISWEISPSTNVRSGWTLRSVTPTGDISLTGVWTTGSYSPINLPTPSRIGYSFLGWSTQAKSSTADYIGGANFTPSSSGITLYAVWKVNSGVYISNKKSYIYVYDNGQWKQCIAYVYDNGQWKLGVL